MTPGEVKVKESLLTSGPKLRTTLTYKQSGHGLEVKGEGQRLHSTNADVHQKRLRTQARDGEGQEAGESCFEEILRTSRSSRVCHRSRPLGILSDSPPTPINEGL